MELRETTLIRLLDRLATDLNTAPIIVLIEAATDKTVASIRMRLST